ncbi:HNH endonuclease [Comamonas phosphati]|nr:HNH endonuclease [Comamonas phosphati]
MRAASQREHDDRRGSSHSRGYTYAWQQARAQFLLENPLCAEHAKQGRMEPASVIDHIQAPRLREARESGDPTRLAAAQQLFWSRSNWQPLCKHCHDSVKQRAEKSGRVVGCDSTGLPLDPFHPWNRSRPGGGGAKNSTPSRP